MILIVDELRWEYMRACHGRWHDLRGHLPYLYATAAGYRRPRIFEAGVRRGMSTRAFLLAAHQRNGHVFSVDTMPADVPPVIRDHPRWHFLQADDLSTQAIMFPSPLFDVLFLDAHDDDWTPEQLRAHVLAELRAYVPRLAPGGTALIHDTQWEPIDTDLGTPDGEVAHALDDYCAETGRTWENRPGFYGLGVLRVLEAPRSADGEPQRITRPAEIRHRYRSD